MLIRSEAELSLVYLCDLPQRRLKITARLVLDATVFDEARKMMLAILASLPAKVVNVTIESVGTSGLEAKAETFLYLGFESIKAHAVDCIF